MRITELSLYKGSTFAVTLDEDEVFYLHRDLVADYQLCCNMELSQAQLCEIRHASDLRRATERALYLLDRRAYSFVELFHKLEETYDEDICYAVLKKLTKLRLINDVAYAQSLARRYVEIKQYGMRRAAFEMHRHGLDADTIQDALAPYADTIPDRLLALIEKKYARNLCDPSDRKAIDKISAALARRGYRYEEIRRGIAAYFDSLQTEEND